MKVCSLRPLISVLTAVILLFVFVLTCLTMTSCGHHPQQVESKLTKSQEPDIDQLIRQMSLEEKIGQMVMIGFDGTSLSQEQLDYLAQYHIGNVILFGQNVSDRAQTAALNTQLQDAIQSNTGIPALIGIDQEGGKVTRTIGGATSFPGNMAIAAAGDPKNAYTVGKYMGEELRALGINVDFAPVLDVNSNPGNPVINVRAYSDQPQTVSRYGAEMISGLQSAGVLACAKHFPGHGDTSQDSHDSLPTVARPLESLRHNELIPFQVAVDQDVSMIMAAHIIFPALDSRSLPASMSKEILTDLLRDDLKFDGLIITDGMQMKAITQYYGTSTAAMAAAAAGADLILLGSGSSCIPTPSDPQADAIILLNEAAANGTLSTQRIDDAVRRILRYKIQFGLFERCLPDPSAAEADWSSHAAFAQQLSDQSVTLIRDRVQILPFAVAAGAQENTSEPAAVDLNQTYADALFVAPVLAKNAQPHSLAAAAHEKFGSSFLELSRRPSLQEIRQVVSASKKASRVVIVLTDAQNQSAQAELVRQVTNANASVVLIAMGSPYDLNLFPEVKAALCTYEYSAASIQSVLKVLAGELPASGTCPVQLGLL